MCSLEGRSAQVCPVSQEGICPSSLVCNGNCSLYVQSSDIEETTMIIKLWQVWIVNWGDEQKYNNLRPELRIKNNRLTCQHFKYDITVFHTILYKYQFLHIVFVWVLIYPERKSGEYFTRWCCGNTKICSEQINRDIVFELSKIWSIIYNNTATILPRKYFRYK